jgi:surfeit locus 1 family protein
MGRFRPGLRLTVLVAVLVPTAIALGFWQLDRAAQKRALEDSRLASYGALPVDEKELSSAGDFTRARITGHYDETQQFFVDNYTRHGVPGYIVVTRFDTAGGRSLLVNRGWIAAPASRDDMPRAPPPHGEVRIDATRWPNVRQSSGVSTDTWNSTWPKRVQYLDIARMATASAAMPIELRLDDGESGSLEPIIIGEEMTPARHLGYAVQWFGLAAATTIAFVALGFRSGKGTGRS